LLGRCRAPFSRAGGENIPSFINCQCGDFLFRRAIKNESFAAWGDSVHQPAAVGTRNQIASRIERQDSIVLYTVEDDGAGVEDAERERIFEPGARGSAGESNGNNGAGLGLPLARRLARSVSGDLVAAPSESGGRFLIRLPGS